MSQRNPIVSVITIFLNPGAAYLAEAVASVRAQSLDDWELILVDDGSTDDSSAFARSAAAAEPERIRYMEHPGHANLGMSASRNLGISAARGRYLAFLDADDTYLPERLAHQVAILDAEPGTAMTYGPYLYWYSWAPDGTEADRVSPLGLATETTHPAPAILEAFLATSGHILPGICSLTVRAEAVAAVGGFEPEFRGCYEDQVFLAKICGRFPVHITRRCLDRYRQHAASCTAQAALTGDYVANLPHPSRERFLRWLEAYLEREGLTTPAIADALKRELWPYDHPRLFALTGLPVLQTKLALKWLKREVIRRIARQHPTSRAATAD
jgi:glycosyltransferase involved in cell wall biosynthesis